MLELLAVHRDLVLAQIDVEYEATEGRLIPKLHLDRERDKGIIKKKLAQTLKEFGILACEVCGFDFTTHYGALGENFIECHHKKPLHTLFEGEKTRTSDLALLCSNCHRMIHRKKEWLSVEELRSIVLGMRVPTT
jgi:5-methylcytosine-specific restriction protein A